MEIAGRTMIFKNDKGYSTTISNKKQDGSYDKMYITVQLPKGVELENKTMILILDGFLSFYKTKDGLAKIKIVVQKYEIAEKYNMPGFETTDPDAILPF